MTHLQSAADADSRCNGASNVPCEPEVVQRRTPWLVRGFGRYLVRYLRRHVHAVRISRAGPAPAPDGRPMVVYMNHPSWWDPLICIHLATTLYPRQEGYGPIDAAVLGSYRFFERIGLFGVEQDTARGARTFLRTSEAILRDPDRMLWITAEGFFTDPRQRPVVLRPGIGHLAYRNAGIRLVPLAIEITFWDQRTPEVLLRFGESIEPDASCPRSAVQWTRHLAGQLERTMDALAAEAMQRHGGAFDVLLASRPGVGGIYDMWRRLKALLRGERFRPEHGRT